MSLAERMHEDLDAIRADLLAAVDRDRDRSRRWARAPLALVGTGALVVSGTALAAGSAAGVLDLPEIDLPGGGTAKLVPASASAGDWDDVLYCPGIGGPGTEAYVDRDAGGNTSGCRPPTLAEQAELERLDQPPLLHGRFQYVVKTPAARDGVPAVLEWHTDKPLDEDPQARGDGAAYLEP